MRDVATAAGVSVAAVSKALNNKADISAALRQKIFKVCDELGYQVNSSIQDMVRKGMNGHTRNIAFVMVGSEFADPAYARAMDGIAKAINEFGYNLGMAHLSGKEHSAQHLPPVIRDDRSAGFIITGDLTEDLVDIFKKLNKPYVILGNYSEKISRNSTRIEINYKSLMFNIVGELQKDGKKKIAYFTENQGNFAESELLELFIKSMKENLLAIDEHIIYFGAGDFSGAFERLKPVFQQKAIPFDSIVCIDFRCAREIVDLILLRSRSEREVEIKIACVRPFAYYKFAIPAIYCDCGMENVAYTGVKTLVEMIEKGESLPPRKVEITPQISVQL